MAYPSTGVSPLFFALVACVGVLWTANSGEALSCFNCEYTECSNKPLKCPYGITKDVCGCCDVCANGVGQECGGESGILGRCGKGLRCDHRQRGNEALPIEITEGICVQDSTPTPPRRGTAAPTKWKRLGEECGGRRAVLGKCVKGLRCDRSPQGNPETPITLRKGVCVPVPATSNADSSKVERRGPSRPDSETHADKASKKPRTTPSPVRQTVEPSNGLNALYVPEETPPLWFVRACWLQRRREAIDRDKQEAARSREGGKVTEGKTGRRAEDQRRASRGTRPKKEEPTGNLRYLLFKK